MVLYIGEPLVDCSPERPAWATRIATIFPRTGIIVTTPGIHATQRIAYTDELNRQRVRKGQPPLTDGERMAHWRDSVDLLIEGDTILIRPDPTNMEMAFAADELLLELVDRRQVKFLTGRNAAIRSAINRRGEAWRILPLPRSFKEMCRLIQSSSVAVQGRAIYYYCAVRGIRILTAARFSMLESMATDELRLHLSEIAQLSRAKNRGSWPELALFMTGDRLCASDLLPKNVGELDDDAVRQAYFDAFSRLLRATPPSFQHDDVYDSAWRNQMYRALVAQGDDLLDDEDLLGLSDEYFMQIHWLAGARMEDGSLIFDPAPDIGEQSDAIAHDLICNLIRDYDGVQFVNIGRVVCSLCPKRNPLRGRRDVFVAHFCQGEGKQDELHIIRFHKWGVIERLDEQKPILQAMNESEEYSDYILDRRLACRQLGMNLGGRVWIRKIQEQYHGTQRELAGVTVWSPYIQREYIRGIATDKVPRTRLRDGAFALSLARVLGRAAAPSIIVGRACPEGVPVFDDGDEMLVLDDAGNITDLVVAEPTGSFADYQNGLANSAAAYARPISDRWEYLDDPEAFMQTYLASFVERFEEIQRSYRIRRRTFDSLFKHRRRDPAGNLAHRWAMVLTRLDRTDAKALVREIEKRVTHQSLPA